MQNPLSIRRRLTLAECVELAAGGPDTTDRHSRLTGREEFTGTADFQSAVNLARDGWTAGVEMLSGAVNVLDAEFAGDMRRRRIVYGMAGKRVNVGRYLSGRPDCFQHFQWRRDNTPGRIVDIVVNAAFSCRNKAPEINRRGAAIVLLIQCLESAGYTVNLTATIALAGAGPKRGRGRGRRRAITPGTWNRLGARYIVDVPLKSGGDYAELDRIAFVLAHPGFLRRIGFGVMERESTEIREHYQFTPGGGYGCPRDLDAGEMPATDGRTVYIPRLNHDDETWKDNARAIQWIIARLAEFGITAGAANAE